MVSNLELLEHIRRGFSVMIFSGKRNTRRYAWSAVQAYLFGLALGRECIHKPFEIECRIVKHNLTPMEKAIVFGEVDNVWEMVNEDSIIELTKGMLVSVLYKNGIAERIRRYKIKHDIKKKVEYILATDNEAKLRTLAVAILYMAITEERSKIGEVYGWEWIENVRNTIIEKLKEIDDEKSIKYDIVLWRLTRDVAHIGGRVDKLADPRYWFVWVWE